MLKLTPFIGNVVIFGASRGLGESFYKLFAKSSPTINILLASRKKPNALRPQDGFIHFDASLSETWPSLFEQLQNFKPSRSFYFPGGGPYGFFQDKKITDHLWALKVNLEFPMHLIHFILQSDYCQQAVFVGSAVAENPDPKAAAYAAGKAGLKNLILTVAQEKDRKSVV